jgi:hypothetical protein
MSICAFAPRNGWSGDALSIVLFILLGREIQNIARREDSLRSLVLSFARRGPSFEDYFE